MEGTGFHYTPAEILETERAYPGLWSDLGLVGWQKRLIGSQIAKDQKRGKT